MTYDQWKSTDEAADDADERPHAPIPDCYGCLGTGHIQWAGVKITKEMNCPCIYAKDDI